MTFLDKVISSNLVGKSKLTKTSTLNVVMGQGQKILTQVGSIFCGSDRVSHLWFGFELGKFRPKNVKKIDKGQKKISSGRKVPGSKAGQPLIYCGSKVSWGQVRAHLYLKGNFLSKNRIFCTAPFLALILPQVHTMDQKVFYF